MSQSKHLPAELAPAEPTRRGRGSATTAEGIAAERALVSRRRGTAHAAHAARRLERASRADRRAV